MIRILIRGIRRIVLPFLAGIGFLWILRTGRRWLRPADTRVLFLIYHRLCDPEKPNFRFQSETLGVTPVRFDDHVAYVTRHYFVLPLEKATEGLTSPGAGLGESVVITFDDGYRDNLIEGLPILQRYQASATLFLATDFIGEIPSHMWNDRLAPLLEGADWTRLREQVGQFPSPELFESLSRYRDRTVDEKRVWINELAEELKKIPNSAKNSLLNLLANTQIPLPPSSEPPALDRLMLTWDEVRQMAGEKISFGAHTCSHPIMTQISSEEAEREITESGRVVAQELGLKSCTAFAFPNGRPGDIPADAERMLKKGNFLCAFTTTPGVNHPASNPYNWQRVSVSNLNEVEFSFLIEYWFLKAALAGI